MAIHSAICSTLAIVAATCPALAVAERPLFARDNLVAWCIVPFDAKHRGPDERAAMLNRLGFTKFAYDWRDEHLPTFDAELAALAREGIELTACWFPAELTPAARHLLASLKKRDIRTQLWVTMSDPAPADERQAAKVAAATDRLRPIVAAAAAQHCTVGLYNHGGWFGEPENQLAIIDALDAPNVGIVYNLHHGHDYLDRLPELLQQMKPHLYAINLNGMDRDGERRGRKILPLGQGELDLEVLRTIKASGYRGPIGVLGHTDDDAEARLRDNLDGLAWLMHQLDGAPPIARPIPRTPMPPQNPQE